MMFWAVGLLACGSGLYAAYHYGAATEVDIPTQRARLADFVISVRTRGDIQSTRSATIVAPQTPNMRIVRLTPNGSAVRKGDTVVAFDRTVQEQNVLTRQNSVDQAENTIASTKATQSMSDAQDVMNKLQGEFNLEAAKLAASKAAVLSPIDGDKARIQVGVSEGTLQQVRSNINANQIGNEADLVRVDQAHDKAVRDLDTAKGYLDQMELKAPTDGVVNVLPNFRSGSRTGRSGSPQFKEGDNVWTGAKILEIPDLSEMYVDLKLDEVDRGKIALGQAIKIHVDSIPDKEFSAALDFISPAAAVVFTGVGANQQANTQKYFPARGTLKNLDDRLRPNTSASVEIIIERQPNSMLIPIRASFDRNGKPVVYVQKGKDFVMREIKIGKRNDDDVVVTSGLREGEVVALVDPFEAARKARKKL
ncbi:MAG: efflux RND transporter periplasmic adaptor subunit [Bryobacteraceae bacterium]|jgi:multidrug resistance efflux pump